MENNIPNKTLKKFARIASEAMIDDPVYVRIREDCEDLDMHTYYMVIE